MAKKESNEALDRLTSVLAEVRAEYGKDTVRTFSQQPDVAVIPTDFYEFNQASSIGGFPLGKLIEISGQESSGKTTLAWQLASQVQRETKKKILFLDFEFATSREYLKKLNVPVDEVIFTLPDDGSLESGFTIMHKFLKTGAFCCAIVDSLAAMVPKSELDSVEENGLESNQMMVKAKALSRALRVMGPDFRKSGATVIFINHTMAKPQTGGFVVLGEPEETPGGKALKFHCDLRISLKPMGYVLQQVPSEKDPKKKVNLKIGREVKLKFLKNRVGCPYGEAVMTLRNNKGFDIVTSVIKRAVAEGIVVAEGKGTHFLKEDKSVKASSYNSFWNLLTLNPTLTQNILAKLNGKAVKFSATDYDMTAGERAITASDLGITEEAENEGLGEVSEEEVLRPV